MIKLYGGLARQLKKKYPNIDPKSIPCKVKSAGEAVRALESQFPGFKSMIRRKGYYKVVRGDNLNDDSKSIGEKQVGMNFDTDTWHIMPIASGAGGKKGGLLQMVLGAILIVVGVVMIAYGNPYGWNLVILGAGMMLGGLVMYLTPVPEIPENDDSETPSYLFNGALNPNIPGKTIPVAYGQTFVGSLVASFGVKVEAYS